VWLLAIHQRAVGVLVHRIIRVGQNHTYTVCVQYFGREITKCTVIHGVYVHGSGQPYVQNQYRHHIRSGVVVRGSVGLRATEDGTIEAVHMKSRPDKEYPNSLQAAEHVHALLTSGTVTYDAERLLFSIASTRAA